MSNKQLPRIVNIQFIPGEKVKLILNRPMHLTSAMSRRGSNKLCFKLTADYCNKHLPEAYNNSLLDINLATGEYQIYPKAKIRAEVYAAVLAIVAEFKAAGFVTE